MRLFVCLFFNTVFEWKNMLGCRRYTGFAWVLKNLEILDFFIEKDYTSWKDVEIGLTQAIRFSEFTL